MTLADWYAFVDCVENCENMPCKKCRSLHPGYQSIDSDCVLFNLRHSSGFKTGMQNFIRFMKENNFCAARIELSDDEFLAILNEC